jgi:hypothetical protein
MTHFKKINVFADRGEVAEKATQRALTDWAQHPHHEFNRMVDSKAAGRTIKAAAADFEFFCKVEDCGPRGDTTLTFHGLIEVKETKHAFRLERKRVTQLARLRKRANCGGVCCVLVYHSTENLWRGLPLALLLADNAVGGSWDLSKVPLHATALAALTAATGQVIR